MKRSYKYLFLLLLGIVVLTGCNKSNSKNDLVGSWAHDSFVYTFNKDMTCTYDTGGTTKMECTYEVDGDKLSILYKENTEPFETTYSIKGNKLNVKDSFGSDTIYVKK